MLRIQKAPSHRCLKRQPPLGILVYGVEGDDIDVDFTMMWAVKRIDSVKHNMC